VHSSTDHTDLFNESIRRCFTNALRISPGDPAMALFILRTLGNQNRAARKRAAEEKRGN
jgi:hypothetical protein